MRAKNSRMAELLKTLALFADGNILGARIEIEFMNIEEGRVVRGVTSFQFGTPISPGDDVADGDEPMIFFE